MSLDALDALWRFAAARGSSKPPETRLALETAREIVTQVIDANKKQQSTNLKKGDSSGAGLNLSTADSALAKVVRCHGNVCPYAVDDVCKRRGRRENGVARAGTRKKASLKNDSKKGVMSRSAPSLPSGSTMLGPGDGSIPLDFAADADAQVLSIDPLFEGCTMLHLACAAGLTQTANALVSCAASTTVVDAQGRTPLSLVPAGSTFATLRAAIAKAADAETEAGATEMKTAFFRRLRADMSRYRELVERGDTQSLQRALGLKAVIHTEDESGETLIQLAVASGQSAVVSLLLKEGAMADSCDSDRRTCLHKAVFAPNPCELVVKLLDMGIAVDPRDHEAVTPLHQACHAGRSDVVALLLSRGAKPAAADVDGLTALHHVMQAEEPKQRVGILRSLVKAVSADKEALYPLLSAKDSTGRSVYHVCCNQGLIDELELCLMALFHFDDPLARKHTESLINDVDNDLQTPLHVAIIHGDARCVAALLGKRPGLKRVIGMAKLSMVDATSATPLHRACFHCEPECVRLLLQAGADPSGASTDPSLRASSPLHYAAFSGDSACLRLLLAAGVDPSVRDAENSSPLHKAAFRGNVEASLVLLTDPSAKGRCDPNAIDDEGSTALHKAAFSGEADVIDLLLRHGVAVDAQDNDDGTALHNAAFNGHVDAINVLLRGKASLRATDESGSTALHLAASSGKRAACVALIEFARSLNDSTDSWLLNATDDRGMTALHRGISFHDVISYLISIGCDYDKQDQDSRTALWYACRSHHIPSAKLLISNGATLDAVDKNGHNCLDALDYATVADAPARSKSPKTQKKQQTAMTLRRELTKLSKSRSLSHSGLMLLGGVDASGPSLDYIKEHGPSFAKVFNKGKAKEAINFLIENGHVRLTTLSLDERGNEWAEGDKRADELFAHPLDVARFLYYTDDLDRTELGEFLGDLKPLPREALKAYIEIDDYTKMDFVDALRRFLTGKFRLPGEAQKIDRFMERFAEHYVDCNADVSAEASNQQKDCVPSGDDTSPGAKETLQADAIMAFPALNPDVAYVLAFSLIMVNTDAHNEGVKEKMSFEQFVSNNRGINNGQDVPREFLKHCYTKIVTNEIRMDNTGAVFGHRQRSGWCKKQGGRWKTWKRRWLVLQDNCLYYFKAKEDDEPTGIIPLENLNVRVYDERSKKHKFEVFTAAGEVIKSCKSSSGQLVQGHHGSYLIEVQSAQEMDAWIAAIRQNIAFNPINELMEKRMRGSIRPVKRLTPEPVGAADDKQVADLKALKASSRRGTTLPELDEEENSKPVSASKDVSGAPKMSSKTKRGNAEANGQIDFAELSSFCEICRSAAAIHGSKQQQREVIKAYGKRAVFVSQDNVGCLLIPNANQAKGKADDHSHAISAVVLSCFSSRLDGEDVVGILKIFGTLLDDQVLGAGHLDLNRSAPVEKKGDDRKGDRIGGKSSRNLVPSAPGTSQRRWPLRIVGHGIAGAAAILFGAHLRREGFRISKMVAFGAPSFTSIEKQPTVQSAVENYGTGSSNSNKKPKQRLPVLRVSLSLDPLPVARTKKFAHWQTPELLLLEQKKFALLPSGRSSEVLAADAKAQTATFFSEGKSAAEAGSAYHSLDRYADHLKVKAKLANRAVRVSYHGID